MIFIFLSNYIGMNLIRESNPYTGRESLLKKLQTQFAERGKPRKDRKDEDQPQTLIDLVSPENTYTRKNVIEITTDKSTHEASDDANRCKINNSGNNGKRNQHLQLLQALLRQKSHQVAQLLVGMTSDEQLQMRDVTRFKY